NAEQEASLPEISLGVHRDGHEVRVVDDADERGHLLALQRDFLRVAHVEHLTGTLNGFHDDADFRAHRLDAEARAVTRQPLDRDPLEVHEEAGDAPFGSFDNALQRLLEHGRRLTRFAVPSEFLPPPRGFRGLASWPTHNMHSRKRRPVGPGPYRPTRPRP